MKIADRQHLAKVIALVRAAKRGWYGMGIGPDLLKCSRCGRLRKALCSPDPSVRLVCSECYACVEQELDQASKVKTAAELLDIIADWQPRQLVQRERKEMA